jgi:hypothetical protein
MRSKGVPKAKKSRFSFVQDPLIINSPNFFKPGVEDLTQAKNWILKVDIKNVIPLSMLEVMSKCETPILLKIGELV